MDEDCNEDDNEASPGPGQPNTNSTPAYDVDDFSDSGDPDPGTGDDAGHVKSQFEAAVAFRDYRDKTTPDPFHPLAGKDGKFHAVVCRHNPSRGVWKQHVFYIMGSADTDDGPVAVCELCHPSEYRSILQNWGAGAAPTEECYHWKAFQQSPFYSPDLIDVFESPM
eukprot:gene8943-8091_t